MDLLEFLTTPLDELYDAGILSEPEPERNVRQNVHTFVCSRCGQTYTNTWARNNPDAIAISIFCTHCQTKTMHLDKTSPHTIAYRSRGVECGSFKDDVSTECWQCGDKERLTYHCFSNRQEVQLCPTHLKEYVPDILRAARKREGIDFDVIERKQPADEYEDDYSF